MFLDLCINNFTEILNIPIFSCVITQLMNKEICAQQIRNNISVVWENFFSVEYIIFNIPVQPTICSLIIRFSIKIKNFNLLMGILFYINNPIHHKVWLFFIFCEGF